MDLPSLETTSQLAPWSVPTRSKLHNYSLRILLLQPNICSSALTGLRLFSITFNILHKMHFAEMCRALQSSSSYYLPNNTTVYTFAWIRFRRAGQQGPIRTLTAALKRSIKTVTGCIYYHTNKIITNKKN